MREPTGVQRVGKNLRTMGDPQGRVFAITSRVSVSPEPVNTCITRLTEGISGDHTVKQVELLNTF
jgi:hypothetical protein